MLWGPGLSWTDNQAAGEADLAKLPLKVMAANEQEQGRQGVCLHWTSIQNSLTAECDQAVKGMCM
jgi:hypothetical protein